jgi:simple sugar transport system substrate-binding protein
VVSFNFGSDAYSALGIVVHFGQDESVAGEAVGNELNKQGLSKPTCVIQEQGNVALEARCGGIKKVSPTPRRSTSTARTTAPCSRR